MAWLAQRLGRGGGGGKGGGRGGDLIWRGLVKGWEEETVGGTHISSVALGVIYVLKMCWLVQDLC